MLRIHPVMGCISRWLMFGLPPGGGANSVLQSRNPLCISTLYKANGRYDPDHDKVWEQTLAILERNQLFAAFTHAEIVSWRGFANLKDNDERRKAMLLRVVDYDLFRSIADDDTG